MSLLFLLLIPFTISLPGLENIKSNLFKNRESRKHAKPIGKKEEVCIMTRDGICLSTNIFYPDPLIHGKGPYHTLFADTPYGKSTLDADSVVANEQGWVFMGQDQRGRKGSNGSYSFWRTQGNDTMDTIEYMANQDWSTGKIASIGVSANCLAQYADIIGVTIYPVESSNWQRYYGDFSRFKYAQMFLGNGMGYQTSYQGGAYRQGLLSGWLKDLGEGDYIQTVLENEDFTTEYWKYLTGPLNNQWYWANISALHFAGWYDIFGNYQIETALYLNSSGVDFAKGNQILIVDPGGHCPIGAIPWVDDLRGWELVEYWGIPAADDAFKVDDIHDFDIHKYFPFNVYFYVLGPGITEEGLYWVQAESFPPYTTQNWYINDGGMLSTTKQSTTNSESYKYDPDNHIRTWGGNNLIVQPCGPQNQNDVEKGRTDLLHFNSTKLSSNFAIVGPIWVKLYVSSDAVDTDFVVKVIDVFPDGRRMLVQDGVFRMRWRDAQPKYPDIYSFDYDQSAKPKNMVKGTIYEIDVQIGHMSYVFNKNHQVGLTIASSNYPRFSLNYNSGNNVIDGSTGKVVATNTVHWGGQYSSNILLPLVELKWLQDRKINWEEFDKMKAERNRKQK